MALFELGVPKADYSFAHQDSPDVVAKTQADRAAVSAYEQQATAGAPAQNVNTAGSFGASMPAAPPPAPGALGAPAAPAPAGGAVFGAPSPAGGMIGGAIPPPPPAAAAPIGAPAPAVPGAAAAGDWRRDISGLNWAGGEATRSTAELWNIKQKYGLTDEQVAGAVLGADGKPIWTAQQVAGHFERFGQGTSPSPGVTGEKGPNGQIKDSPMDPRNETIEGRVNGLLETDANGNYINPVIQQAVNRQLQSANARGLLNSSMAIQAAQEAAFSKAIEIAGPDAQRYYDNRRANVNTGNQFAADEIGQQYVQENKATDQKNTLERDAIQNQQQQENKATDQEFTLRQDYQKAVANVSSNYQRQIDTINASNMTPEDKSVAIAQATQMRDGEIAYQNNVFSKMPGWKTEWAAFAVPTEGMDIAAVSNIDMLANIANDPAQPPERRDAARQRMAQLQTPAPTAPPAAPGATPTPGMIGAVDESVAYGA